MKTFDYRKIEDNLTSVIGLLDDIYSSVDTSEDEQWSKDFEKLMEKTISLKEEMIFTFKIKDD